VCVACRAIGRLTCPAGGALLGSAIKAIEALLDHGVKEEKILFLNLIAAPEGIKYATFRPPT
jgi:uracil phosphoribosyltransferase